MQRNVRTDYQEDIIIRTSREMRNIGKRSINLRWGTWGGTLSAEQTLRLAAALLETVADLPEN